MSDLRNRGQYSQSVREEFEYMSARLAKVEASLEEFLTAAEADTETEGSTSVSELVDIHYGNIAVNNGNTTGSSTLPRLFPKTESVLTNLGTKLAVAAGNGALKDFGITITLNVDGLHIDAVRTGNTGDAAVEYVITRHRVVAL